MATFGFIGCGNMGGALARAVCKTTPADQVFLTNRTADKAKALAEELGCCVALDNEAIAVSADFIFLGVKPQMMADMLAEIAPALTKRDTPFVLVTMAAGLTISAIRELAGGEFGLGAEIGISTQKMHARGPMGLEELTSSKYVIYGEGQVR